MTAETVTNWLPIVGMLALLALFGVLALVDWWRERRQRMAERLLEKVVRVALEQGLMTINQARDLLHREDNR